MTDIPYLRLTTEEQCICSPRSQQPQVAEGAACQEDGPLVVDTTAANADEAVPPGKQMCPDVASGSSGPALLPTVEAFRMKRLSFKKGALSPTEGHDTMGHREAGGLEHPLDPPFLCDDEVDGFSAGLLHTLWDLTLETFDEVPVQLEAQDMATDIR